MGHPMVEAPEVTPLEDQRRPRRRRVWLAALLAAVCPGLGHLYVGSARVALGFAFAGFSTLLAFLLAGAFNPDLLVPLAFAGLALYLGLWTLQLTWATVLAWKAGPGLRLAWFNRAWLYLGFFLATTLVADLVGWRFRHNVLEPYRIPTESMAPALLPGDNFFVVKLGPSAAWRRGDVVVHPIPGAPPPADVFDAQVRVGRVVATEGETIAIAERQVIVNGIPLALNPCPEARLTYQLPGSKGPVTASCSLETASGHPPYAVLHELTDEYDEPYGPVTLGPGQVFVMGDNRDRSRDSRAQGPVDGREIVGHAVVIWFSYSKADGIRWDRIGRRL